MNDNIREMFYLLTGGNSIDVATAAVRLMLKCIGNILKNPDNPKFRRLKVGSREITDRLIPAQGAIECLISAGFQEDSEYFIYPQSAPLKPLRELFGLLNDWQIINSKKEDVKTENESLPPTPSITITSPPFNQAAAAAWEAANMPSQAQEQQFLAGVQSSMRLVQLYEDPAIQKKAKSCIPLNELHHRAQLHYDSITSGKIATKIKSDTMDLRDCMLIELLFWFKNMFFTWFDRPNCPTCEVPMDTRGMVPTTAEEQLWQASRVEFFACDTCSKTARFPRYNHPLKLLSTRSGRCGEWANCFTLCCRALDFEARYVLDWTDHVWTEVYSASQRRWLHCDSCENTCDAPLLYEAGWGKKLSYVLAFAKDDVQDVTWRYSAQHAEVLQRRRLCRESWLLDIIMTTRGLLQASVDTERKAELGQRLAVELVEFMTPKSVGDDESIGRISGSLDWRRERAEVGGADAAAFQPVAFELSTEEVIHRSIHIKYCVATDKYVRVSSQNAETSGWQAGVCRSSGIFRKVETDWKMVYLARTEGVAEGSLSWKFDCSNTSIKIDTVQVRCCSAVFENGCVVRSLTSGSKTVVIPKDEETFKTEEFNGSQQIVFDVTLSGGNGSTAWQHAQLFRQSIKDKNLFPLEIIIKFQ